MYGYFVKVGEFELPFIDLPLEVGANIKDGTCYITQKVSPSNWNYYGYRFDKGVLINSEEFSSTKLDYYTIDKNTDYLNLKGRDVISEIKRILKISKRVLSHSRILSRAANLLRVFRIN